MSKVRVPSKRREGLQCLARLTDDAVKELFAAMATYPVRLYPTDLDVFQHITGQIKAVPEQEVRLILDTLISMYPAIMSSNRPLNVFVADIVASMRDHVSTGEPAIEDAHLSRLQTSLEKLLKVPSISLAAKATNILLENERSLITSRILTDVRPVFDLDTNDIGGGLVIHTLKLEYFASNVEATNEFFVCLDSEDIDELIRNLERAKQKAKKLKSLLAAASVTFIDTDES